MKDKIIYKDGYLHEACKRHYRDEFDESCSELRFLRGLRDEYISQEEVEHYYEISPLMIETINNSSNPDELYETIYNSIVMECAVALAYGAREYGTKKFREVTAVLEEEYLKPAEDKHVKVLSRL